MTQIFLCFQGQPDNTFVSHFSNFLIPPVSGVESTANMCSRIEFRIILLILCPGIVFTDILQLPFSNDRNVSSIPTRAIPMPPDRNSSKIQNASVTSAPDGSAQLRNDTDSLPGPWLADMFYQALSNFTVQENVGTTICQKQTQMYVKNLKNNSYWAVKSK